MKNVLVVDDSALMRSVICDIINSDKRFHVADRAIDGENALNLLVHKSYDAVILDVNMPKMTGLELLKELRDRKIVARVIMASTDTKEGTKTTLDALSLGAIDFIHKPENARDCKNGIFNKKLIGILETVCECNAQAIYEQEIDYSAEIEKTRKLAELASKSSKAVKERTIICIASSTGGPKALQDVVPLFPSKINAPIVIVQHMPEGFTASLAERLDSLSDCKVTEAFDGEILKNGQVYIARGGRHLNIRSSNNDFVFEYTDQPSREGVRPCANYMFESLSEGIADKVICVVLTGMGADGTQGILNLRKDKKTYVITQSEETCTVYGMPKSAVKAGLSDCVLPLKSIAQEVIMNVGVDA